MKVLHVTQNYYPSQGGTQHTMRKISEYLYAHFKDEVAVYTTNSYYGPNGRSFKKIEKYEEWINGVYVKRFDFLRGHKPILRFFKKTSLKMWGRELPGALSELTVGPVSISMKKALLDANVDVVCASTVHYRFADYGIYRNRNKQPKPFVLYGALHLETEYVPEIYIKRIKAADHYIANTKYEKDFLVSKGLHPDKITVAGAATDILKYTRSTSGTANIRNEIGIGSEKKMILCISRQEVFKGLPVLLEAFRRLQTNDENICLVIAGSRGSYTDALQKAATETKNLFVITNISEETKRMLLQETDIVVLPSKEESFGVVFLEAWSFKKPVIGARIGAIQSLIDEDRDGYLFVPDNSEDLAHQIKRAIMTTENNKLVGQQGFEKVQQYYTWDKVAVTFRNAYLKAIEDFKKGNKI